MSKAVVLSIRPKWCEKITAMAAAMRRVSNSLWGWPGAPALRCGCEFMGKLLGKLAR